MTSDGPRFAAAGCEASKHFEGLDANYYVEEVLSIERDFPGSAKRCYRVSGLADVERAAREEFAEARTIDDLEYSHVLQIG